MKKKKQKSKKSIQASHVFDNLEEDMKKQNMIIELEKIIKDKDDK